MLQSAQHPHGFGSARLRVCHGNYCNRQIPCLPIPERLPVLPLMASGNPRSSTRPAARTLSSTPGIAQHLALTVQVSVAPRSMERRDFPLGRVRRDVLFDWGILRVLFEERNGGHQSPGLRIPTAMDRDFGRYESDCMFCAKSRSRGLSRVALAAPLSAPTKALSARLPKRNYLTRPRAHPAGRV